MADPGTYGSAGRGRGQSMLGKQTSMPHCVIGGCYIQGNSSSLQVFLDAVFAVMG